MVFYVSKTNILEDHLLVTCSSLNEAIKFVSNWIMKNPCQNGWHKLSQPVAETWAKTQDDLRTQKNKFINIHMLVAGDNGRLDICEYR